MTDDVERQAAAEIEQTHPRWIVIWGCYSHLFWAYPRFQVPKGTVISAPDCERLLTGMHSVELEASANSRVPVYEPPRPAARLPVQRTPLRPTPPRPTPPRPTPGQAQRGALPVASAPAGASGWQDQSERANYDPYVSSPFVPDPYGSDPDDSDRHGSEPDDSDPYDSDPYDPDPDDSPASWRRLWRCGAELRAIPVRSPDRRCCERYTRSGRRARDRSAAALRRGPHRGDHGYAGAVRLG